MILTDEDMNRIAAFMKNNYGVNLENKRTLITGRLDNQLTRLGYESFTGFIDCVERNPKGEEATLLVNSLTTNHTFFMREPIHFNFMRNVALPEIREKERNTKDVRIWSAAASSGEEAYSIVMTLKDFFGFEATEWDTTVLATDISTKVLDKARQGIFKAEAVEQLPQRWIKQHFSITKDGDYQVKPATRNEVVFNNFNLMTPFPFRKKFHIIFLRNVMIYFDDPTKDELLKKMADFLETGGYLFVGTTETIDHQKIGLHHIQPSIYQK